MPDHDRSSHVRAILLALLVTVLWSSSWVLIRWGLDDEALEPVTFAGLRYGLGATVLVVWGLVRRRIRARVGHLDKRTVARILVLGLVFYALTQGAQFVAIDNQPAATTSLVLSWTPLLVALLGGWSIAESSSSRQRGGALLVVAGAWLFFAGGLGATAIGMTAAFVGLAANVASSLLGRHVNRDEHVPATIVTALSMAVGAVALLIAGLLVEGIPVVSPRAWLLIGWLAVVNTAWAFTLWNLSLQRLSAIESAAVNNTMLIQIAVLAWVFLDEALGVREVAGILLVTTGIFLTQTVFMRRSGRPASSR